MTVEACSTISQVSWHGAVPASKNALVAKARVSKIKLADPTVRSFRNARTERQGRDASARAEASQGVHHHGAPMPSNGAAPGSAETGTTEDAAQPATAERCTDSSLAETGNEASSRTNDTFGIDLDKLKEDRIRSTKQFLRHYAHAEDLKHRANFNRKRYRTVEVTFVRDDGGIDTEHRFVRIRKPLAERINDRNKKNARRVMRGYYHLSDWVRLTIGKPRKTGTQYGSKKGEGSLLDVTSMPVDHLALQCGTGRWAMGAASYGVSESGPLAALKGTGDALNLLAAPTAVSDAMGAADGVVQLCSTAAEAEATMLACHDDALRFRRNLDRSTAQEAKAHLAFKRAGVLLVDAMAETDAAADVAVDSAIRNLVLQPPATALSVGSQLAGYADAASPLTGFVTGPINMVSGVLEIHQSYQAYDVAQAQKKQALQRGQVIAELEEQLAKKKHALDERGEFLDERDVLLEGGLNSVREQQARLAKESERDKKFELVRAAKGATSLTGGIAGTIMLGLVVGGVAASAALPPLGAVLGAAGLAAAFAMAVNGAHQKRLEHDYKWRERAAEVFILKHSREEIARLMATGEPVTVTIEEGEYLPGQDRFAGGRTISVHVCHNEYVGLYLFASQLQDLVQHRCTEKDVEPWIDALTRMDGNRDRPIRLDRLDVLAICKAASAEPAHRQLDYIESQIVGLLGLKRRLGDSEALAHPSVFIDHFRDACRMAQLYGERPGSVAFHARVRDALASEYGDEERGMAAFRATMETFLLKTEKLPFSPLRSSLRAFLTVDRFMASGVALPEAQAEPLIEVFRALPLGRALDECVRQMLASAGASTEEEIVACLHLAAARLADSSLPAKEVARIEAQMNAFILMMNRS